MKKLAVLALTLVLLLCGCGREAETLEGTWQGNGTMDDAPFAGAETLTFDGDGVVTARGDGWEARYRWSVTDDCLSLVPMDGDGGFGLYYTVKGDALILADGEEFYKVD